MYNLTVQDIIGGNPIHFDEKVTGYISNLSDHSEMMHTGKGYGNNYSL